MLFDEARAFIANIEPARREGWFVWKDDWPDWRLVSEVEGLTEPIYRVMHVAPPAPPRGTATKTSSGTKTATHADAKVSRVTKISSRALPKASAPRNAPTPPPAPIAISGDHERFAQEESKSLSVTLGEFILRAKKRFTKRLQVLISGEAGQTFSTFTRDISVGGINFEEPLPDWVQGYFKVRIAKPNSKQKIELTCSLIEGANPPDRLRAIILPLQSLEDEKNLEMWIAA